MNQTDNISEKIALIFSVIRLYCRVLLFFSSLFMGFQLLLYFQNLRLYQNSWPWPISLFSFQEFCQLNFIVFLISVVLFLKTHTFFTCSAFLRLFLIQFRLKRGIRGPVKRNPQEIFLMVYFFGTLFRFIFFFFGALFSIFVLTYGSLTVFLHANPLYWLNAIPFVLFVTTLLFFPPKEIDFHYWLEQFVRSKLPQKASANPSSKN